MISVVLAADYATYPKVPKTASINGFADPIYDLAPECMKSCLKFSTSNTPCPYWDTGCFCVMPQWSGLVGQCIAQNCKGDDVASATFLATSLCSVVGANTWMMPASISTMLSSAAGDAKEVTTIEGKTAVSWVTAPGSSAADSDASETGSASSAASSGSSESASESESESESESSGSSSSASSTSSPSSSSNMAVLQTGGVGTILLGVLMYLVV
ncbi:MAG: CFEM domain-containing protein [Asgard group archaeon]|nr:CFEM domain-containing protein [Asgard group archaeon]